ncbi:MAG: universal stress protein, partial [Eggerthellaceae bacterium]|nr:universal stress protein [Eggerthellaceae bacterium]
YDGSDPSKRASQIAKDIAHNNPDIEMTLVYVMRLYSVGDTADVIDSALINETNSIREELEQIASELPVKTKVKLLKGTSPSDLIVKCALDEDCDLILMGSRGKGGVTGYLGSVSYAVTKNSPITVIIAKEGPK